VKRGLIRLKDKAGSLISSKQLIFIIVGSQIGLGIFSLPRVVSGEAGKDAWMAIILGAIIPLLSLYLIERLCKRMPEMGFTQIAQALFGKITGSLLIIMFIAYVIFFHSIVVRVFAEVTKLYLLPQTPLAVVLFMYVVVIVYVGSKGARVIGRLNELMFYILLIILLILIIPIGQTDYTNLLPVGQAGFGKIVSGALTTAYYYAGIEILLVFYTLVSKKEDVLKAGCRALSITVILYLAVVIICQLAIGVDVLQRIIWPGLILLKVVQVPVLERLEFVFLFFWLGTGARPAINMGFAASLSLSQLLKIDQQKFNTYSLMFIGLCLYIMALVPYDVLTAFKWADYAGYGFFVIGLGYPLLFHMALLLWKGKVEKSV
jgi:spore germination protein (amino acid permease)